MQLGDLLTAPWRLTEAPKEATLALEASYAGSSCTELLRWHVSETSERVEVLAVP